MLQSHHLTSLFHVTFKGLRIRSHWHVYVYMPVKNSLIHINVQICGPGMPGGLGIELKVTILEYTWPPVPSFDAL